jgi:hypothetical protein
MAPPQPRDHRHDPRGARADEAALLSMDADDRVPLFAAVMPDSDGVVRAQRRTEPTPGFLNLLTGIDTNQWGGWKHPGCTVWAGRTGGRHSRRFRSLESYGQPERTYRAAIRP